VENDDVQLGPNVGGARKLARKLFKDSGVNEIPVSLWKVINHLKAQRGLDIMRVEFETVDGALLMIDGQPTIGFNPTPAWVRRRLTIAHEIGHFLMGHVCGQNPDSNAEREAYQFGAELLIPLAFIRGDFSRNPDLEFLAKKYLVSKEALCRHLMECRVI
jgi:Zn-dependent peptidase ImmA (M78 family)